MVMETDSEKQFLDRLRRGESGAFQRIIDRWGNRAVRIAYGYTGDWDDAQDILQETLIKVNRSVHAFRDGAPFEPWFFRILVNTCRDHKRGFFHRNRVSLAQAPQQSTASSVADPDFRETIRKIVRRMPPKMRIVFLLRYQEDYTVKEIAEVLGISADTVRVQVMKARRFIREKYERMMGDIENEL